MFHEYDRADYHAAVNEEACDVLEMLHVLFGGERERAIDYLRSLSTSYRDDIRALEILENDEYTEQDWE